MACLFLIIWLLLQLNEVKGVDDEIYNLQNLKRVSESRRQSKIVRIPIETVANEQHSEVRPGARGESASPNCMQHLSQHLHGYLSNSVIVLMYILMYRSAGYDNVEYSSLFAQIGSEIRNYDGPSFHRHRRSVTDDVSLHFNAFNESFKLSLRQAPPILHPGARIVLSDGDTESLWEGSKGSDDCFLVGDVTSHPGGTASMALCDHVIGTISTESHDIFIRHFYNEGIDRRNKDAILDEAPLLVARKKRQISLSYENRESEHLRQHSRRKRAIQSGDITVELAVYTDAEFTASLGVTDTQSRVELMLVKYNGVQMEWSRADQLGYNVTFQIKYMNFFETNPAWLDTSSSLLGTWLSTFCAGKTTDPYDLFYMHVGTQNLDVTGRAYLSSACNQNTNCGVDNTLNPLEYVATSHEIGHNFGMLHDADAGCTGDDVGNMGNYGAGWSTCNADQIHNFLRDFNVECLWEENIPTSQVDPLLQGVTLVPELPGQFLSADQVCEAKYGDGFQFRMYPLLTVCTIHSCVNHTLGPKYGQMFREDYIPGLYCADGMICFKRACETWAVAKQENLEVREGGWGQWGEWSGCSRTCGRGVNFRRRACDSPIPKNHPTCEGNRFDAQTCNVQACDGDSTDETTLKTQRASETCALLVTNDVIDSEVYRSTGSVYSSTRHGQCEVLCDTVDGSDVPSFTRFGLMPQGTPCTAEDENQWDRDDWPRGPGYTSMCIDGYCEKFGCDGQFNGAQYDECGVCGGDDSTCDVISGFDNATQSQGERRILATLPVGAFNIQFWFTYSEMRQNYIEIYTKEDAIVLASYRSVNWIFITGDNPVSYADTEWHFNYNSQFLHAEGPITEPAVIKLFQNRAFDNVGIYYIYSVPLSTATCSGSCENGGMWNNDMCACECPSGYMGNNCSIATSCATVFCLQEKPIDESNCQCQCGDNSYRTRCTSCTYPFTGVNCATCKVSSCQNGGIFNESTCRCSCPPSFGGLSCEVTCTDKVADCETRVGNGQCVSNNEYMEENCMLACGLCELAVPTTTTTTISTSMTTSTTTSTTMSTTTEETHLTETTSGFMSTTTSSPRWQTLGVSWCHPETGSVGSSTKCTKFPSFNDYQYSSCLTASEVISRSSNTRCADDCRGYCVLSCMVERYGIENGNVTADCLCDPGLTTDAETGLPTWCFRPQGECNFFSDCLQAKYSSCGNLPTSQLTSHCGWFTDNLYFENCLSRAWIREIRHCFQAYFVQYLEAGISVSCTDVSETYYYDAFDYCLRKTLSDGNNFCDIPETDRASVLQSFQTLFDDSLNQNINSTLVWMDSC